MSDMLRFLVDYSMLKRNYKKAARWEPKGGFTTLSGPPGTIVWRPANCSHSSLSFGTQRSAVAESGWARVASGSQQFCRDGGEKDKWYENKAGEKGAREERELKLGRKRRRWGGGVGGKHTPNSPAYPSLVLIVSSRVWLTGGRCWAGKRERETQTLRERCTNSMRDMGVWSELEWGVLYCRSLCRPVSGRKLRGWTQ